MFTPVYKTSTALVGISLSSAQPGYSRVLPHTVLSCSDAPAPLPGICLVLAPLTSQAGRPARGDYAWRASRCRYRAMERRAEQRRQGRSGY